MKYSVDLHITFFSVDGSPEELRGRIAKAIHTVQPKVEQSADVHIDSIEITEVRQESLLPK